LTPNLAILALRSVYDWRMPLLRLLPGLLIALLLGVTIPAAAPCAQGVARSQSTPEKQLARDILKELVEINTTDSAGDNTKAAEAVAARLKAAGYPDGDVLVLVPGPRKGNVVARLRGKGQGRPILFIGHLDVVEARREDWSFDPFTLLEKDSYFYGRGTQDMKGEDSLLVANFIRLKREGYVPGRDLILALTADEEGGNYNGIRWLINNRRDLVEAAYCVNADAGGGQVKNGTPQLYSVSAAEKTYFHLRLTMRNPGGHSSLPVKENAIYRLAEGLVKLETLQFPVQLNEVTRAFFERMSKIETGQTAADMKAIAQNPADQAAAERLSQSPYYNALLRTTCVATELTGGHAPNALPQTAEAGINCRLVPTDSRDEVEAAIRRALADPKIEIRRASQSPASPFSPVSSEVLAAVEKVTALFWPGLPIVPIMETGGTDGRQLRIAGIPTYGVSAIFADMDDIRAHGRDERISVDAFYQGLEFNYQLLKALGGN
jgi:acetylornithine deacetylase/succinyl-diaminopimelate desuccinylase-like protein